MIINYLKPASDLQLQVRLQLTARNLLDKWLIDIKEHNDSNLANQKDRTTGNTGLALTDLSSKSIKRCNSFQQMKNKTVFETKHLIILVLSFNQYK